MEFLDNSGHIFTLKSYSYKPIGHEYDENDYIFWIDVPNENFLSVDNYYMRSIYALIDLKKYGMSTNEGSNFYKTSDIDKELEITIEMESNKYQLIGSVDVQDKLSDNSAINDLVDLSDDDVKKNVLTNSDLMFIKTEGSYRNASVPFLIVPFYVIANSNDEGTWLTNILIHIKGIKDESDEYCSITVGGEFRDNYEELMINAQNMGVVLPKNIIKGVYNTSFYNNEFNEVIFNQKIKEYMMNYMNIRGEQGNFRSAIDSLEWFGWGDKIELSKLMKTDNQFKSQYFLDYFNTNVDVLESFQLFKNTSFISLKVKLNDETGEHYKRIIDENNDKPYFEGEENPVLESLLDKQVSVTAGFDNEKFSYIKQYYDFMLNELGLKLSCLKYHYQKYFLPIHLKIHGAYLAHKVYANDIKFATFPKVEMTAENIYLPELSRGNNLQFDNEVEFLGQGVHYFVKQYDFFIDDQYNEFNGFLEENHKDYYYLNDTCINIPIKFRNTNKQYNCVLLLEKEIENSGNYPYTWTIKEPFNYFESFAVIVDDKDVVEYKDLLMAYREYPIENNNENYSLYFNSSELYKTVRNELSKTIEVTSNSNESGEIDEDTAYNLRQTFVYDEDGKIISSKYMFNYCGHEVFVHPTEETYQTIYLNGIKYTLIVPPGSSVNVNVFYEDVMSFVCYRVSQFNIKFRTDFENVTRIMKYSEAGIEAIDSLKILPNDIRILKYEDRRKYIIMHYDEYKWVELINSTYIDEEDIFNISYNTTKNNIEYSYYKSTVILSSILDSFKKKNLTTHDILQKLLNTEKFGKGGEFEDTLYVKDILGKAVWNKDIEDLIIKRNSYALNFSYKTTLPAELVYESHFIFAQTEDHYYKNFIICPRIMKHADMRYWQNVNFRLSLLVNNKWYEYRFVTKMPEPIVQIGRLKYNYWETDENFYSRFSQIKYIDRADRNGVAGEIVFNNFMYEPSLVTVNNVNYYDDLLEENKSQHIVNYNSNSIDLFKECQDFIVYENNDISYIIKFSKSLLKKNKEIHIPKVPVKEGFNGFKEIILYKYEAVNNYVRLDFFVKYDDFDTYEYKSVYVDEDSYIDILNIHDSKHKCTNAQGKEFYIREILYNDSTLRDKYKFDVNIPTTNKYLNSVCLFNLYKKIEVERNLLNFRANVNLSVNGILFDRRGSTGKFLLSGAQLWTTDMNTGEVVDNEGNTVIEGSVDTWHDRWYDFEKNEWMPKIMKKYMYYVTRDPKTGEQYVSTEQNTSIINKIEFYSVIVDDIKAFQKFVADSLDKKLNDKDSWKIIKKTENKENTYYVTADNGETRYPLRYRFEFVAKGDDGEYNAISIDQKDVLKYVSNKYYILSNDTLTPIKIRAILYYDEDKSINNIPVIIDVEKKHYSYIINNLFIDENRIEWIDDNKLRIFDTNYENYEEYDFVSAENIRMYFRSESGEMLTIINKLEKTTDENGNTIYRIYDAFGENPIDLIEFNEYRFVDFQGNDIGTENPVNYWVELEEVKTNQYDIDWGQLEYDLNIVAWHKDNNFNEDGDFVKDEDMEQIAKILREKVDTTNAVPIDKNSEKTEEEKTKFDYLKTEDVPEITEYSYNKDIYLQQNIKNIEPDKYTLTWYDNYTGEFSDESNFGEDSWENKVHNSISLVVVIRDIKTDKPVKYDPSSDRTTQDPTQKYLIYNQRNTEFEVKEGEYITVFFTIYNKCEEQYDGFWLLPYIFNKSYEYVPLNYINSTGAEETEISFEFNNKTYRYGTNQTTETIDLYSRFFKEKYIVYRNMESDSITKILERDITDSLVEKSYDDQKYNIETSDFEELSESEQIDAILRNPLAKYVVKYEQQLDLNDYMQSEEDNSFQLDYDLYLMHDESQWYCMFISRQTLDKVDEFSNIYNLKHSDIYFETENALGKMDFKLEFNRFENRFLINRYYNEVPEEQNAFDDTDIITAQLVNNDRLPVHLDVSAKYRINSLSIGSSLLKEVDSNCEMTIISIPNNNSKYYKGFYKVDVNYSLDGFTQQSYKDTKKFKIYKT